MEQAAECTWKTSFKMVQIYGEWESAGQVQRQPGWPSVKSELRSAETWTERQLWWGFSIRWVKSHWTLEMKSKDPKLKDAPCTSRNFTILSSQKATSFRRMKGTVKKENLTQRWAFIAYFFQFLFWVILRIMYI